MSAPGVLFINFTKRTCYSCGKKKDVKGGTRPDKGWKCKDCKDKEIARVLLAN